MLQRLNRAVFADPAEVIGNHRIVEEHVNRRLRAGVPVLAGRRWELPELLPPREHPGPAVVVDGDHWRALRFIAGARSVEVISGPEQARQVGIGLGVFHLLISDLPVDRLVDTLEGFHITPTYLARYDQVRQQGLGVEAEGTEAGSDGGAFKAAAALVADDAACGSTAQGTDDGSCSRVGAIGAGDECGRTQQGADEKKFHGLEHRCGV